MEHTALMQFEDVTLYRVSHMGKTWYSVHRPGFVGWQDQAGQSASVTVNKLALVLEFRRASIH